MLKHILPCQHQRANSRFYFETVLNKRVALYFYKAHPSYTLRSNELHFLTKSKHSLLNIAFTRMQLFQHDYKLIDERTIT